MPTQFEYPETGWSTGKMAKIGPMRGGDPGREYRELEGVRKRKESRVSEAGTPAMQALGPEEWQKFWGGNWSVHGEASTVDPSKTDPGGFVIKQGHPQIKELEQGGWQSYGIPDEGWKGWQFMRPPQDDKTPVAGYGGRVA